MKYIYRFTTTDNGRKKAEVYVPETGQWKIVGIKSAEAVIARGHGVAQ